ncbi:hypothetical protein BOX15_Mlig004051g2 [Macrostomum lignano]|uniref:Uncharacterized protein n=1 Tax=Macrostomum lignano TaxID=282301 RepID=A0A267GAT4_9PLAT|nr:hypothetical protein BOX15_Mlig004051g2 [Macrostomum lignano]
MAPPSSRSLDCGGQVDRKSGSSSPDPESTEPEAEVDASRMDLTTLLLQGFDPTAYEQRLAERRLAKFTGRSRRQPRSILASTLTKTEATAGVQQRQPLQQRRYPAEA